MSVAPTGDCAEALGRFKGPLRRSPNRFVAPLIRPVRFRDQGRYRSDANLERTHRRDDLEREVQGYSRKKKGGREHRADRPRAANTPTGLTASWAEQPSWLSQIMPEPVT